MNTTRGQQTYSRGLMLFLPLVLGTLGCVRTSSPLDLTSPDPAQDQRKIAGYYSREADFYRLKADEFSQRAHVYEDLFGSDSEWVKGARLLIHFYEDAAKEQERLSSLHLNLAAHGRHDHSAKPVTP
ncbi:MAG TPA: hypothetical protein VKP13_16965 [Nitrospira sp.]|nr:hypothetical protein [Nitrospira sp.]